MKNWKATTLALLATTSLLSTAQASAATTVDDLDCAAAYVVSGKLKPAQQEQAMPRVAHAMQRYHDNPPAAAPGESIPLTVGEIQREVGSRMQASFATLDKAQAQGQQQAQQALIRHAATVMRCDQKYGFSMMK